MGTHNSVLITVLCLTFVLATHQESMPAKPTDINVAQEEADKDWSRAFLNFLAERIADTFTVVIVDNIFPSGKIINNSQKTHRRIFNPSENCHVLLFNTRLFIIAFPLFYVLRIGPENRFLC